MMKAYIKVKCIDRLPDKSDWYDTSLGQIYFYKEHKRWGKAHYNKYPIYWLEPLKLPTEEEIEEAAKNNADAIDRRGCSYWNGLFEGYQMGQRDLLSKLK